LVGLIIRNWSEGGGTFKRRVIELRAGGLLKFKNSRDLVPFDLKYNLDNTFI